ncbi:MAG TPA: hypothetical protein VGB03_09490, partial [Acidimicrobiales bacterium]
EVMPAAEVRFLVDQLFEGEDGLAVARRIDRRVDALPGLAGLHLVESACVSSPHDGEMRARRNELRTARALR